MNYEQNIKSPYAEKLRKEENAKSIMRKIKIGCFTLLVAGTAYVGESLVMNTPFKKVATENITVDTGSNLVKETFEELTKLDKIKNTPTSNIYERADNADEWNKNMNGKRVTNTGDQFKLDVYESLNGEHNKIEIEPAQGNVNNKN